VVDGVDGSYHARIFALLEVAWGIGLAVIHEGRGVVIQGGQGGEDATAACVASIAEGQTVEAGVVGRGVDEGFEDGAGGSLGDGVIELGGAVVATTDEG